MRREQQIYCVIAALMLGVLLSGLILAVARIVLEWGDRSYGDWEANRWLWFASLVIVFALTITLVTWDAWQRVELPDNPLPSTDSWGAHLRKRYFVVHGLLFVLTPFMFLMMASFVIFSSDAASVPDDWAMLGLYCAVFMVMGLLYAAYFGSVTYLLYRALHKRGELE